MRHLAIVFLALLLSSSLLAQAAPSCVTVSAEATVQADQSYTLPFTPTLSFRLSPWTGGLGWEMQIVPGDDPSGVAEYSYMLTPPYRSSSPRYVVIGWGVRSAKEAAANSVREFRFVLNKADYLRGDEALKKVLWQSSDDEYQRALDVLAALPSGAGKLTVLDYQTVDVPGPEPTNRFRSMRFRIELTVPADVKLSPAVATSAKQVACEARTFAR